MEQPFRSGIKDEVGDETIARCETFLDALKLSRSLAVHTDRYYCHALGVDPGQWSRIWSGDAHFPQNKLPLFMELSGNLVPLRWLALHFGYGLYQLLSEVEKENIRLKEELEREREKLAIIQEFVKGIGR